jgi:hypothetical protein
MVSQQTLQGPVEFIAAAAPACRLPQSYAPI